MNALDHDIREASKRITAPLHRERRKSHALSSLIAEGDVGRDAALTRILPARLAKVVRACCIIAREMGMEHPAINREIGEKNE